MFMNLALFVREIRNRRSKKDKNNWPIWYIEYFIPNKTIRIYFENKIDANRFYKSTIIEKVCANKSCYFNNVKLKNAITQYKNLTSDQHEKMIEIIVQIICRIK